MNKKIIRGLYLGTIRPADSVGFKTETYKEHLKEFERLYNEIEALLPDESRGKLNAMMEENNIAESEIILNQFVKGFELGISLAVEGLCADDD